MFVQYVYLHEVMTKVTNRMLDGKGMIKKGRLLNKKGIMYCYFLSSLLRRPNKVTS